MGFDCYDVLNLSRSASSADVSRAYRRLALKFHPDKDNTEEAAAKFLEVAKAYDILSERKCLIIMLIHFLKHYKNTTLACEDIN